MHTLPSPRTDNTKDVEGYILKITIYYILDENIIYWYRVTFDGRGGVYAKYCET